MARKPEWPELLHEYVDREFEFIWGEVDCCLFAADWVLLATGTDHMSEFRGRYRSKRGAYRVLQSEGYGDITEALDKKLVFIPVAMAQRGDIVCHDFGEGSTLGICLGQQSIFLTETDTVLVQTFDLNRAWRVV